MKVNILGQEYEIKKQSEIENPKLKARRANGLAELYSKELIISTEASVEDEETYTNLAEYEKKVLRHEIVHAFFHEAGLNDYCHDEQLVDWIALQIPKMYKAMNETDCIG